MSVLDFTGLSETSGIDSEAVELLAVQAVVGAVADEIIFQCCWGCRLHAPLDCVCESIRAAV